MEKIVHSLAEFSAEAERFATSVSSSPQTATLVTLSGNLGAGKTAFTKAVAGALGVEGLVNSPTFVLEKIYELPAGKTFKHLVHIDAYRLEGGSDLIPLGFNEIMRDADNLILLEWPEIVSDALPAAAVKISIEILEDGSRKITYG